MSAVINMTCELCGGATDHDDYCAKCSDEYWNAVGGAQSEAQEMETEIAQLLGDDELRNAVARDLERLRLVCLTDPNIVWFD